MLSPEELEDAQRREEADWVREDGRKRFAKEIAGRVDGLRDAVKSVKGDIMGKGRTFEYFSDLCVFTHHPFDRRFDTYICNCQDYTRCLWLTTELSSHAGMGSYIVSNPA